MEQGILRRGTGNGRSRNREALVVEQGTVGAASAEVGVSLERLRGPDRAVLADGRACHEVEPKLLI